MSELHTTKTEIVDPVVLNYKSCDLKFRNCSKLLVPWFCHLTIQFPYAPKSARSRPVLMSWADVSNKPITGMLNKLLPSLLARATFVQQTLSTGRTHR